MPKNIPIKRQVITFLSMVASGIERAMTAIINESAVPNGMPLLTKTCIMGTTPAALAYIGTPAITDSGTAYHVLEEIYCSKNPVGMKPCIMPPIAIPIIT